MPSTTRLARLRAVLLTSVALAALAGSVQTACSLGEHDEVLTQDELYGNPYGYGGHTRPANDGSCKAAGGHCLGHNAPSAKGQGPATCEEFGRSLFGGPLRSSPLDCRDESVAPGGSIECCVP